MSAAVGHKIIIYIASIAAPLIIKQCYWNWEINFYGLLSCWIGCMFCLIKNSQDISA